MAQVALPPGVYTIHAPGLDDEPFALTNPAENGQPLTLQPVDAHNPDQQFIVNASGLIIASFNRNSLAYSQIPSLVREPVKRSTTGVPWLINVAPVEDEPLQWTGYIFSPDENKLFWHPNGAAPNVVLRRAQFADWTFTQVIPGAEDAGLL